MSINKLWALGCLVILASCGGSNSSPATSPPPTGNPNNPPPVTAFPEIDTAPVVEEALPRIDIITLGNTIVDEPKVPAQMRITTYTMGEPPVTDYQGDIGVEYRGSSSQSFYDKKSLGVETQDESGDGMDVSLLGMPEEEDWVLHGPYGDKTLIRNALMFDIGQAFGRYASRWDFTELYVDGEYRGVYVLLEKVKRDDNRIDINNLKEDENEGEDLTGGYIVKLDKTNGEHADFPAAYDLFTPWMSFISRQENGINNSLHHFIYHDPKPEDITDAQRLYIQDYIHDFEAALAGDAFTDEELGYRAYVEVDSFVDYFLATEISGNVDGYRLSTFLYKDKNGKLTMGPLWDYNLAFGNADYCEGWRNDQWVYRSEERCDGGVFPVPFWWHRLLEDESFVALVKARWQSLRETTLSDAAMQTIIEQKVTRLQSTGAVERNFERWDIIGDYVWPNYFIGATYEEEVDYLQQWLMGRLVWLDEKISQL